MELVAHLLVIERMIQLDNMFIQQIRKVWHCVNNMQNLRSSLQNTRSSGRGRIQIQLLPPYI